MGPMQMREDFADRFGIAMPWKEAQRSVPSTATETERGTMIGFSEKPKATRGVELFLVLLAVGAAAAYASREVERKLG